MAQTERSHEQVISEMVTEALRCLDADDTGQMSRSSMARGRSRAHAVGQVKSFLRGRGMEIVWTKDRRGVLSPCAKWSRGSFK